MSITECNIQSLRCCSHSVERIAVEHNHHRLGQIQLRFWAGEYNTPDIPYLLTKVDGEAESMIRILQRLIQSIHDVQKEYKEQSDYPLTQRNQVSTILLDAEIVKGEFPRDDIQPAWCAEKRFPTAYCHGHWWIDSGSPQWRAHGRSQSVGGYVIPIECWEEYLQMKSKLGEPPSDLSWGYGKQVQEMDNETSVAKDTVQKPCGETAPISRGKCTE